MLTIDTARIFEPFKNPSRFKGAWGEVPYAPGAKLHRVPFGRDVVTEAIGSEGYSAPLGLFYCVGFRSSCSRHENSIAAASSSRVVHGLIPQVSCVASFFHCENGM